MVSLAALREIELEHANDRCADHPEHRLVAIAYAGSALIYCIVCKNSPKAFVEVPTPTKAYRQGRALPAAVANHVERRLGVTTESKALVQAAKTAAPSRLPNDAEVKEILSVFHGWEKDRQGNALSPARPTAVILWKLMQMGFSPQDINLLGGKPYINTDGMAGHAQRLLAAQGRRYGIEYMVQHRLVTDKTELTMVGARQGDTTIAFEFMVPSPVKTTYADGRIEERVDWKVVATEYGRGNGTPGKTVIRVPGGRDKPEGYDQPVELQHPQRMAWVRADRHGWKLVAPVTLPAGVGYFDPAINAALEPEVIEGTSRVVDAPALAEHVAEPETEAGTDTPAEASSAAPEATEPFVQAAAPVQPAAVASGIPTLTPARNARPMADVRKDQGYARELVDAIKASGVTSVREFGYSLQLGMDAVYQLAADGYAVEQIVAIVSGKATPSLGW